MGDLVEGQPEPEVVAGEGIAPLEGHQIGTHVVNDVLVLGCLVLHHQEVVLTEHPGGHPAQDHPEFHAAHPDGQRRGSARLVPIGPVVSNVAEALEEGS